MIVPEPKYLHSADICRDGGTYIVLYLDELKNFYEIELPVITGTVGGRWGRIGYKQPVLKSYDPLIQGKVNEEKQLTWADGIKLREKLVSLMHDKIEMGGRSRAEEMLELLCLKGKLPNEP